MSSTGFIQQDIVIEGSGAAPAPVAPSISNISLVGGAVLVAAEPAAISGLYPVAQLRLYRGASVDGPWTAFAAQNLSLIAQQTLLFDWNPAYGTQQWYAVSAIDSSGAEGGLSAPQAFSAAWIQSDQENVPVPDGPGFFATDYGFATAPESLITDQFPQGFNLLVPPPGMTEGPLHMVARLVSTSLLEYRSRVYHLLESVSMQTAQGAALDAHGVLYGVTSRLPLEIDNDDLFRQRLNSLANAQKGRLSDIQAAVQAWYNSYSVNPPTVTVFDLRSNPAQAAADGLQILQYEVAVVWNYPANEAWFLGSAYLGNESYLGNDKPQFVQSLGPDLDAVIARTQAAGTQAVYKISATYS